MAFGWTPIAGKAGLSMAEVARRAGMVTHAETRTAGKPHLKEMIP